MPRLPFLAACAALLAADLPAADYRVQASTTWAENLSRTSFAPTEKDAALYRVAASANLVRQLAPNWTAFAGAELEAETVPDFDALDRTGAAVRGTLRRKFGLGPQAPLVDLGAGLQRLEFRESGRSGWREDVSLTYSQRFGATLRLLATGGWERVSAGRGPYDTQQRRLALEAAWDATERWQLRAGYARLAGQFTANAAGDVYAQALAGAFGPAIQSYYSSVPFATTGSFGPGWVAYRVESDADLWWTELSFAAAARTTVALRQEQAKVINIVGVRYDSAFWSLNVVHQF